MKYITLLFKKIGKEVVNFTCIFYFLIYHGCAFFFKASWYNSYSFSPFICLTMGMNGGNDGSHPLSQNPSKIHGPPMIQSTLKLFPFQRKQRLCFLTQRLDGSALDKSADTAWMGSEVRVSIGEWVDGWNRREVKVKWDPDPWVRRRRRSCVSGSGESRNRGPEYTQIRVLESPLPLPSPWNKREWREPGTWAPSLLKFHWKQFHLFKNQAVLRTDCKYAYCLCVKHDT